MTAVLCGNLRAEIVGSAGIRLRQATTDLLLPRQPALTLTADGLERPLSGEELAAARSLAAAVRSLAAAVAVLAFAAGTLLPGAVVDAIGQVADLAGWLESRHGRGLAE